MSKIDLPFKTTFAAQIRAIEPSENELRETQASLTDLKAMLPAGIDPENDPQLLYIAANLYVAGIVNLNDDGVDIATSLASYKGFEKQQINIEHNRSRIAGYILHAGLSEFGTDRLISEEEAQSAGKPFNVAVVAVLWKVANRELCDFLAEASNPLHPDYKALSLSFEVGFSSYNIGVIDCKTRVISEAKKVIRPEDSDFESMSKKLRAFGGSGKIGPDSEDGVYQILSGTFLPLGGGIVTMPAAAVKGITAITEAFEDKPDENSNPIDNDEGMETEESLKDDNEEQVKMCDLRQRLTSLLAILDNSVFSHIIYPKNSVSSITSQTIIKSNMNLKEIKEKVASAQKLEDYQQVVAGILEIAQALEEGSVKLSDELEAEKNRGAEIEKNRAEAVAASEELKKNFDALKLELDELKKAQESARLETVFNERMAQIDEVFELSDEDRKYIVEEIKDIETDEVFAAWLDKNTKVIRKEKTKAFKAEAAKKQTQFDELVAAIKAKGLEVKVDENQLIKEVIASAQSNNISAPITNTIDATKNLKELVAEEFAEHVTIGGKKIKEYNKKY